MPTVDYLKNENIINPGGYGFDSFDEAMSTVDEDNPDFSVQYKIMGEYYELKRFDGRLVFSEVVI